VKTSTIAIYASVFTLLVVVIAIGYTNPEQSSVANSAAPLATTESTNTDSKTAVNDVVASNIASSVAKTANLSVASSVESRAISTEIQSALPTSDDASIAKPQIVQVSSASRAITQYTVEPGDTTDSLAAKFGISKDTIKWANNLTSDNLTVGNQISILPRDGITYTAKAGDTVESIATKYGADASVIRTYNDLEISGLTDGLKVIIPGGVLPDTERPGYVAPRTYTATSVASSSAYAGFRAGTVGNRYAYGNCTWWVYERRAAIGRPVGSFWGNGGSWGYSGAAAGLAVNNTPEVGAVLVEAGSPGHVAFVEVVNADGSIVISEMNNSAYGGFNIVNNRTISAGQAGLYKYVH
jgi:surface antigen